MQSPKGTCSVSSSYTINGSHSFTIKGYSLTKGIGIGKAITSKAFTIGGHQWRILFYPDGKTPQNYSEFVSVFLELDSEANDVRALFELTLFDQSGKEKHKVYGTRDKRPFNLGQHQNMWGYECYDIREKLEKSDYLKDDCLKFHCTIGVVVRTLDFLPNDSIDVSR